MYDMLSFISYRKVHIINLLASIVTFISTALIILKQRWIGKIDGLNAIISPELIWAEVNGQNASLCKWKSAELINSFLTFCNFAI